MSRLVFKADDLRRIVTHALAAPTHSEGYGGAIGDVILVHDQGVYPGAEISALSNSCMEPVCDVALVGGHRYLAVMHALVKGFVAAGAVEAHARVIEINGPIGCMRRDLRRWLLDEEGRSP